MPRPVDPKDLLRQYTEAKNLRQPYENDFARASAFVEPRAAKGWTTNGPLTDTSRSVDTRYTFDNTGMRALPKFISVIDRMVTPLGMRWALLQAEDETLRRKPAVQKYFYQLSLALHSRRYSARAGFVAARTTLYRRFGVYGWGPMKLTWRKPSLLDRKGGFRYKTNPAYDHFILEDGEGSVTHHFWRFWRNARQFKTEFPNAVPPKSVKAELDKPGGPNENSYFEFVWACYPSNDHDPEALDRRRFPWAGSYICVPDSEYVGDEGGYSSPPFITPRIEPGELYGAGSPALRALPTLGTVNAMKRTMLRHAQRSAQPSLLAADDGVLSGRIDVRPDHVTYGGVNSRGEKLVHELQVGRIEPSEVILQDERSDIDDSFFVTLFRMFVEKERTATEVIQDLVERNSLLAPTMGALHDEDLGPMIEREIALLAENDPQAFPEMPPELAEAGGNYAVKYTSPMAKGIYAEEDQGGLFIADMAMNWAKATGDARPLRRINLDAMLTDIADHRAVPPHWMHTDEEVAAMQAQEQEAQDVETAVKAAPAAASVVTAAMKEGGRTVRAGMR